MATTSFTLPAPVANFLNLNVPGFAAASGGVDTVALQVPSFAALPAPVVAGLNDAGIRVQPDAVAAAPVAVPQDAAVGLAQFAPAGLAPQGAALADPDLAGANAFAQNLAAWGEAASAFFQAAAANPPPADPVAFASWAAAQQQAVLDYFGGM